MLFSNKFFKTTNNLGSVVNQMTFPKCRLQYTLQKIKNLDWLRNL